MKVESIKERLVKAVTQVERVTGKNLSLPVLSCILFIAKENQLTLRATNLDLGIEISIPVKVEKEGTVAVPGSLLSSLLTNLYKDSPVTLESKEGNLLVKTDYSSSTIKTFSADDFPTIPLLSNENTFSLEAKELIRGIKSVWYSASLSSIKPELSSIYIYSEGADLVFVATDSFRLAEKRVTLKKTITLNKLLIPHKVIPELLRVLDGAEGTLSVTATQNQIAIRTQNLYLTSRVIDGTFPDYRQIIPKETTTTALLLKQDMANALKISTAFSDKFNQVHFTVAPGKKTFEIASHNADTGETTDRLVAKLSGEDISMNFNHKYVSDCFQSIDSESISLTLNGAAKPMIISGAGDSSFRYLVMPMNR